MAKREEGRHLKVDLSTCVEENADVDVLTDSSESVNSMYTEYMTWPEVVKKHDEQIRQQPVTSTKNYRHDLGRMYEQTPIFLDMMIQFSDVAGYPQLRQDAEALGMTVTEVGRGGRHMVGALQDGRVVTLGSNELGALGRRTNSSAEAWRLGVVEFPAEAFPLKCLSVSAGENHSAALSDGDVYVWGTFCDEKGEAFGLLGESTEKVFHFPTKLKLPVKISSIRSGDNHMVLHSIEQRGLVFTFGSTLSPLARRYEEREERSMTLRDFLLTPLQLKKNGPGDFFNVQAHGNSTIIHVVMRSEKLVWANLGRFFIFGEYDPEDDGRQSIVQESSSSRITFQVTDRRPRKSPIHFMQRHLVHYLGPFEHMILRVICGTEMTGSLPTPNGFVDTVLESYCHHHNLLIRPDDVLTSILVQLTLFFQGASLSGERRPLSSFTKSNTLTLKEMDLETASMESVSESLREVIAGNWSDEEVRELFSPNFTTTTVDDVIVNGVLPMAKVKSPFDYDLCPICGIPNLTLSGTLEDWVSLRQRLELLQRFQLDDWLLMLRPILDQFVKARSGDVDLNFWRQICHFHAGYGGPNINGWITVFSAFNEYGRWQGNVTDDAPWSTLLKNAIAPGFVEVKVEGRRKGKDVEGVVIAGHVGKTILEDGFSMSPKSGWTLLLKE